MATIYVNMELDVWRYITDNKGAASNHKGYTLYEKEHFSHFKTLPSNWYYCLNQHGEGTAVDFPIKTKPMVSWSARRYIAGNGKLQMAPRMPGQGCLLKKWHYHL